MFLTFHNQYSVVDKVQGMLSDKCMFIEVAHYINVLSLHDYFEITDIIVKLVQDEQIPLLTLLIKERPHNQRVNNIRSVFSYIE